MCCASKYGSLVALVVAASVAGSLGFAQPEVPKAPKLPEAPKLPKAPKLPEVPKQPEMPEMPDMQKMQEAWEKAMAPGTEHAHLEKAAGTWEGEVKMWMMPGAPPSESTCSTVITSIMGGRYTQSTTKGTLDMGEGPRPFEGMGIYGFNNVTKQYESTWIDNMGTGMMTGTGTLSADGKVLTWTMTMADPITGKNSTSREVDTIIDDNHTMLEMFGAGFDGKETKMMEIKYTRKK